MRRRVPTVTVRLGAGAGRRPDKERRDRRYGHRHRHCQMGGWGESGQPAESSRLIGGRSVGQCRLQRTQGANPKALGDERSRPDHQGGVCGQEGANASPEDLFGENPKLAFFNPATIYPNSN